MPDLDGQEREALEKDILPRLLRVAAEEIEQLQAQNAELAVALALARNSASANLRGTYRRGYFTGHAAGKRGAVRETAPERHARGKLKEAMS